MCDSLKALLAKVWKDETLGAEFVERFYKEGNYEDAAKLFGTLSLADLLQPLTMGAGAPKLQFNKEILPAVPPAQKLKLIAPRTSTGR